MTREQAKREIDSLDYYLQNHTDDYGEESHTAMMMAIKALEQESILDKVRAEIEPKCDRINSLASVLPYTAHREIQELLCEIMDLFEPQAESEG